MAINDIIYNSEDQHEFVLEIGVSIIQQIADISFGATYGINHVLELPLRSPAPFVDLLFDNHIAEIPEIEESSSSSSEEFYPVQDILSDGGNVYGRVVEEIPLIPKKRPLIRRTVG